MTSTTRSAIFTAYNALRPAAHEGYIDAGRLNRALGLAQSNERRPYETTIDACSCADSRFRRGTCKHRLALLIGGESPAAVNEGELARNPFERR